MKNNIRYKLFLLVGAALLLFVSSVSAQNKKNVVSQIVTDQLSNPLAGVLVSAPLGESVLSDVDGRFEVQLSKGDVLSFEKEGYDKLYLSVDDLDKVVVLVKPLFLQSEKDKVDMGISTKYRREMVGAVSTINPEERLTYDNTQWVRDYIQGLIPGVRGSGNIRGLGNAIFVIDGVIGRDPNILLMEEVEQITVLKDANAVALYGNQAKNGVIVINTKRGQVNKRTAKVNMRYGIKTPVSMPSYLNATDYMTFYNEARANDGLAASFDSLTIANTKAGTNPYRYPDLDLYSDDYLKKFSTFNDINAEFSGGSDKTQYYVNMGWGHTESLVKINPEVNTGSHRFNLRGNIDFKVNSWIKSSIDAVAIINTEKSALTNILNTGASLKPNAYAPLIPVSMVDTSATGVSPGIIEAAKQYGGMLLGSNQMFKTDAPIANIMAGGYQNSMYRSSQFNNSIDLDLDMITDGLSARTYLSFDFYDSYKVKVNHQFSVYEPTGWNEDGMITALQSYGTDRKDQVENVSTNDYVSRLGFYGLINYYKQIKEDHVIDATFLTYYNTMNRTYVLQQDKDAHLGLQLTYDYKKKFYADFSAAYANSIKLPEGNRGGLSPTGGLSYILSEESFIKDIKAIDFLKIKATAGVIKSDKGIGAYYLYSETYDNGQAISWADGSFSNSLKNITQGANSIMTFEERVDLNLGLESYLFSSLWLEFNVFKSDINNQLTKRSEFYPSYYNIFRPIDNYNRDSYSGVEMGFDYTKNFNDLSVNIGGNLMYSQSKVKVRDEIYEYDYQYRKDGPTDAMFGLTDNGFYTNEDFVTDDEGNSVLRDGLATPAFGAVMPGDIKYVDQNGDMIIDNNDQKQIGVWNNPLSYGLNLKVSYKGLSLFVLTQGQKGGNAMRSGNYYWLDGSDKYSDVLLNRWTPETSNTADYPRLSSNKNDNNFKNSTFWLYDNSFFDIDRAQITYEFNNKVCRKLKMSNLSVNIAGINLVRFSSNKEIQELSVGGDPQYRYFTLGLRTSF